jgi:hypothetical protein
MPPAVAEEEEEEAPVTTALPATKRPKEGHTKEMMLMVQ